MITWASIPYTKDANKAIEYLKEYGHNLILSSKFNYEYDGDSICCRMEFKCKVCGSRIILSRYGGSEKEYILRVNDDFNETAMFYCEKYRSLY